MAAFSDDLIPVKRPHFELRDGHLFFLASNRPYARLDSIDAELWGSMIDGFTNVGILRVNVPDVDVRLERLWDLGVCEMVPSAFPANRADVLVLEPHMDDAVLSAGGAMWARRMTKRFTLVTLAGRSNYTSYYELDRDYFDPDRVSAIRRAESALVMRMLGGRHEALDLLEAPLRLRDDIWSLDWFRRHHKLVDAFIMHASPSSEIEMWAAEIARLLRATRATEIWLPLGVGTHTDHELARDASLLALSRVEGLAQRTKLEFYQDVPYATQFPEHSDEIVRALEAAGAVIEPHLEDVSASMADKLRLASVYGSQFKSAYMAPRIEEAAREASGGAGGFSELRYRVLRSPGPVTPTAAYSRRAAIEQLSASLEPWYRRHRSAARLRVLTPVPVARWADDMSAVLDAFPDATLEVHVSEEYADEVDALASPRLDVHVVRGREAAWLARLARCAVSRPMPTVVLTGEGLAGWVWLVRAVFIVSDVVAAPRMNDVVLSLGHIRAGS